MKNPTNLSTDQMLGQRVAHAALECIRAKGSSMFMVQINGADIAITTTMLIKGEQPRDAIRKLADNFGFTVLDLRPGQVDLPPLAPGKE